MRFPTWLTVGLKGVGHAFIGGAANALIAANIAPESFNFGAQWKQTATLALTGGVIAVAYYLRQPPYPTTPTQGGQS